MLHHIVEPFASDVLRFIPVTASAVGTETLRRISCMYRPRQLSKILYRLLRRCDNRVLKATFANACNIPTDKAVLVQTVVYKIASKYFPTDGKHRLRRPAEYLRMACSSGKVAILVGLYTNIPQPLRDELGGVIINSCDSSAEVMQWTYERFEAHFDLRFRISRFSRAFEKDTCNSTDIELLTWMISNMFDNGPGIFHHIYETDAVVERLTRACCNNNYEIVCWVFGEVYAAGQDRFYVAALVWWILEVPQRAKLLEVKELRPIFTDPGTLLALCAHGDSGEIAQFMDNMEPRRRTDSLSACFQELLRRRSVESLTWLLDAHGEFPINLHAALEQFADGFEYHDPDNNFRALQFLSEKFDISAPPPVLIEKISGQWRNKEDAEWTWATFNAFGVRADSLIKLYAAEKKFDVVHYLVEVHGASLTEMQLHPDDETLGGLSF